MAQTGIALACSPDPGPATAPPVRRMISRRWYTCRSNGLGGFDILDESNGNVKFEANVDQYLPLLRPKLTKAGKVAVHQPHIPKQVATWWKAQCGFRGLAISGTVSALQDKIRYSIVSEMTDEIKNQFEGMKVEYARLNDEANQKMWAESNDDDRAKKWPKRFLSELTNAGPNKEVRVVEVDGWGEEVERLCTRMNIPCEMTKMPNHRTGQRLVVVGLDKISVRSKFAEITREAQREVLREAQESKAIRLEAEAAFSKRYKEAVVMGSKTKCAWCVLGEWEIKCPELENDYGTENINSTSKPAECELELMETLISKKGSKTGPTQIWGLFDFLAVTGVLRLVDPKAKKHGSNMSRRKTKHGQNLDDDESDKPNEFDDDDEEDPNSPPACFSFPRGFMPSLESRQFEFRWRGEETGEGEIQLGSDKYRCSITFEGPDVMKGIFETGFGGKHEFRGIKKEIERDLANAEWRTSKHNGHTPSDHWNDRSAAEYARAETGRWH